MDLRAEGARGVGDRGVALQRIRLGVCLVAQARAAPLLERRGDHAGRISVQDEERRASRAEVVVEIPKGLEEEAQAVGAHALRREEPGVEHEDGLHRGRVLARAHQRGVIVQAKALSEPEDRSRHGGSRLVGSGRGADDASSGRAVSTKDRGTVSTPQPEGHSEPQGSHERRYGACSGAWEWPKTESAACGSTAMTCSFLACVTEGIIFSPADLAAGAAAPSPDSRVSIRHRRYSRPRRRN